MKKLLVLSCFCMMAMLGFSQTVTSKTEVKAKPATIESAAKLDKSVKAETRAEIEKKACDKDCKKACCKDKTKAEKSKCKKSCKKDCCKAKTKACAKKDGDKKACCAKKETTTEAKEAPSPEKK